MKKIVQLFLLAWLISACTTRNNETSPGDLLQKLPHHIKLSWETAPKNSQSVTWRTTAKIRESYLEYAETTASPFFSEKVERIKAISDSLTSDDGLWHYHSVNITGLKPGTMYSYRVGDGAYWSAWAEFTTASVDNKSFNFLYFGDVQRFIFSLGSRTVRQAVLQCPDAKFMLFGGDMVHRGALNKENWNEFLLTGGWVFQNIPILATPGNHEHLKAASGVGLSPLWHLTFRFPKNGPNGHEEETYYVDYKNLRVISLNLNRYKYPEDREVIYKWTEERLKEYKDDWLIVTTHYNVKSLARNRSEEIRFPEFKALFEKYNVPLILSGHEHVYGRGHIGPQFPVYVVSVAGSWQNAIRFDSWLERAGTSLQLYQKIEVQKDTLHYITKTVKGDIYDEFWISKDKYGNMSFEENENLCPESLIPPINFESRYDKKLVESYEADKAKYLKKRKE